MQGGIIAALPLAWFLLATVALLWTFENFRCPLLAEGVMIWLLSAALTLVAVNICTCISAWNAEHPCSCWIALGTCACTCTHWMNSDARTPSISMSLAQEKHAVPELPLGGSAVHVCNCFECSASVTLFWQTGVMRHRQHCRLTTCIELVELTNRVSDDKIQITILKLRRGALSNETWEILPAFDCRLVPGIAPYL